jgi:hypothetical protein
MSIKPGDIIGRLTVMVLYLTGYEFAHSSRSSDERCVVYPRTGLIGHALTVGGFRLLYVSRGRYVLE